MRTIEPDPDIPEANDRTVQRLQLAGALDEVFPQWRDAIGEPGRSGTLVGTVAGRGPAGVPLGDDADRRWAHADELEWFSTRSYLILRTPQAPRSWVRALPRFPVSYQPDVLLWSREIAPDGPVARWQLLHTEHEPVQLVTSDGQVVPWVLRGDESYDLEHDVESGWQVWSHPEPESR